MKTLLNSLLFAAGVVCFITSCDKAQDVVQPDKQLTMSANRPPKAPQARWVWNDVDLHCNERGFNCFDEVVITASLRVALSGVTTEGAESVAEFFKSEEGLDAFAGIDVSTLGKLQSGAYCLTEKVKDKHHFYLAYELGSVGKDAEFVLQAIEE